MFIIATAEWGGGLSQDITRHVAT